MRMPERISQNSIIPRMASRTAPGGAQGCAGLSEFGIKESRKRASGNLCQDARQVESHEVKAGCGPLASGTRVAPAQGCRMSTGMGVECRQPGGDEKGMAASVKT